MQRPFAYIFAMLHIAWISFTKTTLFWWLWVRETQFLNNFYWFWTISILLCLLVLQSSVSISQFFISDGWYYLKKTKVSSSLALIFNLSMSEFDKEAQSPVTDDQISADIASKMIEVESLLAKKLKPQALLAALRNPPTGNKSEFIKVSYHFWCFRCCFYVY